MPLFDLHLSPSRPAPAPSRRTPPLRLLALALPAALWLGGCSTPVLDSSVVVPGGYAAAAHPQGETEVDWWESYADPVLSDLIRRAARENRDAEGVDEEIMG